MTDTAPTPPPAPTKPAEAPQVTTSDAFNRLRTIKVYTHSPILYWWPVWLLGFVFFDREALNILPAVAFALF